MNRLFGFERLPDQPFPGALSFGGGDGAELLPILDRLDQITMLEPSEHSTLPYREIHCSKK